MDAHPSILDRELAMAETAEVRTVIRAAMEEVVNHGTWALVRCQASASNGQDRDIAPITLYRHVLEECDGIQVACQASAADAAVPMLRSLYEALWSLGYILEDPSRYEERSLAYVVAFEAKRRADYVRLDATSAHGQKFSESLKQGWSTAGVRLPESADVQRAIANLDTFFAHSHIAPVKAEYDATVKRNRGRPVRWHALYGGPPTLSKLAVHLREGAIFDVLYGHWSAVSHATNAYGALAVVDGQGVIKRLRTTAELAGIACQATQATVRASQLMLGRFRKGEVGFLEWYKEHVRPHVVRLGCLGNPATED